MNTELELEPQPSRYVVGIDLGTTNSALAYVDTSRPNWQVDVFPVTQLVAPSQLEIRETLPSFHYQPPAAEAARGVLRLPWSREDPLYSVGIYAREFGTHSPGRQISSAKSWLCHSGVDRHSPILPWHAADDVDRLSPVQASSRYLAHLRDAWDAKFPRDPLTRQDVVLTLPASFDEIARELTVEAAREAGLNRVVLIEEPQAAFYAWIHQHAESWHEQVSPGQKILVCDIGGGTSDFTLIRVRRSDGEKVQFHRVAVGDHLILGGDNLDLALARDLESKLSQRLSPRQWEVLVRSCRKTKEEMLGPDPPASQSIHLPAGGSRLIESGIQCQVTREQVEELLVNGFFPQVQLDEKPAGRRSGFQEFGLPFTADPAVTRHLAAFLTAHRHVALDEISPATPHDPARPDIVLFNGGMFESPVIRQRLLTVLSSWFSSSAKVWTPTLLANDRLDLAVARGAAYYGMVRRGEGVRIAANLARSYYMAVESPVEESHNLPRVLCLVPGNAEPGQIIELTDRDFELRLAEPVEFPLFVSSTRLTDRAGELVVVDAEQMKPLPPIRTALRTRRRSDGDVATVRLKVELTEIGTLALCCSQVNGDRSWQLEFDVRSATQTEIAAQESAAERQGVLDESVIVACRRLLDETFSSGATSSPDALVKDLAGVIGAPRDDWPPTLLRRIWEELIEREAGRRRSPTHEVRWLNLLGYALRPGFGIAVDDWRVGETWRQVQGKLVHGSPACRTESLILWRRVSGGLSPGQQRAIAEPLLAPLRSLHKKLTTGKERGDHGIGPNEASELWRLLGSLELLPTSTKLELGRFLVDLIPKRKLEANRSAMIWALGRIGARVPTYGPLNTVVSGDQVASWLDKLLDALEPEAVAQFTLMLLARRTNDRYRDLDESVRSRVLGWLERAGASPHLMDLVGQGGELDRQEQGQAFGESLPKGLRLKDPA